MIEAIANSLAPYREAGFGVLDLCLAIAAVAFGFWVYLSRDTHGYITVGYRVPFDKLPGKAKAKLYLTLALGAALVLRVALVAS